MAVTPIPKGYHTVTPYILVKNAAKFIDFMASVFEAKTTEQFMRPDGKIGHTELRIGDSVIMLSEAMESHPATPVMLYLYVPKVDEVFERAIRAGANVVANVENQFYGDRAGSVKDPTGNTLWIATHVEDVPPNELKRRAATAMQAKA